eukprot:991444-Pleurochrysis_carterae.AAC.1
MSAMYKSRNFSKLFSLIGVKKTTHMVTASSSRTTGKEVWIRVPLTLWENHAQWMSLYHVDKQNRLVGRLGGVHGSTGMKTVQFLSRGGRLLPPDE